MSYQDTETWDFGFEFKNEVKEPETKSWKFFILVFVAINKVR